MAVSDMLLLLVYQMRYEWAGILEEGQKRKQTR